MDNHRKYDAEATLKKEVANFLRLQHKDLLPFLNKISELGIAAFLFGGILRDLMMLPKQKRIPRDIDVVVHKMTANLRSFLELKIQKHTRFGGVEINLGHWDIDLWELSDTWASRSGYIEVEDFETLPKTTFLNVQAIVVEINGKHGQPRVFEHGFFQAFQEETIDINFEENPFPTRCAFSALATAYKLGFSLSPRLIRYILHQCDQVDLQELCNYQQQQVGRVTFTVDILADWINHLKSANRHHPRCFAKLPTPKQMTLPWHSHTNPQASYLQRALSE